MMSYTINNNYCCYYSLQWNLSFAPKSIHKWAGRGEKWSGRAKISFIDVLVLCCSFCAYFGRRQGANYGNTHTHKLARMTVTELNILSELVGVCCIRLRDRMRECVPGGWPQHTWLITHIDRPTSSWHTRPMCATFFRPPSRNTFSFYNKLCFICPNFLLCFVVKPVFLNP